MSTLVTFLRLLTTPRVSLAALDQAFVSLRILVATLIAAASLTAQAFGTFSVILTTHLVAEGVVIAACGEPFLARHSTSTSSRLREATRGATGFALLAVLPLALLTASASLFSPRPLDTALLLLALGMPGLLLQPIWRYVFLASGTPRRALSNDALNGLLQIGALVLVLTLGHDGVATFVAAWSLPPLVSAVFGAHQARLLPGVRASLSWLRDQRPVILPYVGEFLAGQGAGHLAIYAVALITGLSAAGALRAGLVLYGPLTVLFMSARNIGQVEMVRMFNEREDDLGFLKAAISIAVMCALGALFYGALLLSLPSSLGEALLGETWSATMGILLPLALMRAFQGGLVGSAVGLRVVLAVRRGFQARILGGGAFFASTALGAYLAGLQGAAVGLAVGSALAATVFWGLFLRARAELRSHGDFNGLLRIRHQGRYSHRGSGN